MGDFDKKIDVAGMSCPMPLINLRKTISTMTKGQILKIRGDDPVFKETVTDYCTENTHTVKTINTEDKATIIMIEV